MSGINKYYKLKPIKLGCEVHGIKLHHGIQKEVISAIKEDVTKHRILVFKNQGIISGERQVEIAKWFGEPESTFYQHPKSPHFDIFRVSNDAEEGCTNVGRTGWHIDGSFQEKPFSHSIYHIISVPKEGATSFVGLNEIVENLSSDRRERWERLYMESDRRACRVQPLIYSHPLTFKKVLCFHLGMTESFIWDYKTEKSRRTKRSETLSILGELYEEIMREGGKYQYRHEWCEGDFIISDNIAVGHEATPETQLPREEVGLRVMHRVTVGGTTVPTK